MKTSAVIAMAAFLMSAAVPAFADTAQQKELCQIAAKNCLNTADILQKRVKKLNAEIKKGSTKYSADDLKILEQKLKDAQDQLDKMEGKK